MRDHDDPWLALLGAETPTGWEDDPFATVADDARPDRSGAPAGDGAATGSGVAPVVLVVGACGGVGTSTIASGLGLVLAAAGRPAWLVDADPGRGDLHALWGIARERTLGDLSGVMDELTVAHLELVSHPHGSGVRLLPAPERSGGDGWVSVLLGVVATARMSGAPAIVDAGALPPSALGELAAVVDQVLVVVEPSLRCARRARELVAWFDRSGAVAVVNDHRGRGDVGTRGIAAAAGIAVAAELPCAAREAERIASGRLAPGRRARLMRGLGGLADRVVRA